MLALMKRALEPSTPYPDKLMYMTSVGLHQTICTDFPAVVEKIEDLVSSSNTRLQGLQLLEIALQQYADIYLKGRWTVVLYDILKDPSGVHILKEQVCRILCMMIPCMAKDPSANSADLNKFVTDLFPFLMRKVDENVEWTKAACKCINTCLISFPQALACHKDHLLSIVLKQVTECPSSKTFELFADIFSKIPACIRNADPTMYKEVWLKQYLTTLSSMQNILNSFLSYYSEEAFLEIRIPDVVFYAFDDGDDRREDFFPSFMRGLRRFINLSKCLAKMLSTKSKYAVQVPVKLTLQCLIPLFQISEKIKPTSLELQLICSNLTQMQIAGLIVLEAIISNFELMHLTQLITQLIGWTLQASRLGITTEPVSQLRLSVWKLMNLWLCKHGAKVAIEITNPTSLIIDELLKDISIEDKESSQSSNIQTHHKSKKNMLTVLPRNHYFNKNQQSVCNEALKSLSSIIYAGAPHWSKRIIQEVSHKILQIAHTLQSSYDQYPFPYDNDSCRKNLYTVLLAIVISAKADQRESVQCVTGIFKNAMRDPSIKVTRLCHKASAEIRMFLHPKRPSPLYLQTTDRRSRNTGAVARVPGWTSEEYAENLPVEDESEAANENAPPADGQPYSNEVEIHSEEYMEGVQHYSEPSAAENQCNGEDIVLEAQSSSQCQDDIESEDEDEEEDEERSYGEEDMNQEEIQSETMYIPSTNKLEVLNPVQIDPESVQSIAVPEYEELKPCSNSESCTIENTSNKNMHLNGVVNIVPDDENVPSSSTSQPIIANENGIYAYEEDDLEEAEEEEEGEEDEEEENVSSFPAEKKVPEFYDPPVKRQKLESDEAKEVVSNENDEREQNSRSPTLSEMKADFCCNEVEDVQS